MEQKRQLNFVGKWRVRAYPRPCGGALKGLWKLWEDV